MINCKRDSLDAVPQTIDKVFNLSCNAAMDGRFAAAASVDDTLCKIHRIARIRGRIKATGLFFIP